MLTTIIVLGDWASPDGATPDGIVSFNLMSPITDATDGEFVPTTTIPAQLVNGTIAQPLVADTSANAAPTTLYRVTEEIDGATQRSYYISVPAAPVGSRAVSDGVVVQGIAGLVSATGAFTGGDVGKYLFVPSAFPVGTQILTVIDAHTVTTSTAALKTGASLEVLIGAQVNLATLDTTA